MSNSLEKTPASPSSAYELTAEDRRLVRDMLEGLPAIRRHPKEYLTQWPKEGDEVYKRRLNDAEFTPLFADLLFGLSSKPFSKDLSLKDPVDEDIKAICEDIDGEGNNLHVFAHSLMKDGVADGLVALVIDYPQKPEDAVTRADESRLGLRPYWVKIKANDLIAVYTEIINGVETITHARFREDQVLRDGWDERHVKRVRVLEPGKWELFEEVTGKDGKQEWQSVDSGDTTLKYVPMAIFYTADRNGPQNVTPPLIGLARMQRDLFRLEANLQSIETRAAFPMLTANGMQPPAEGETLEVGPMAVLYGGEGSWGVIEPGGMTFEHFRNRIEAKLTEMRRLGMQPLLPGAVMVTATASSIEADKAHSAVQMWALGLKDVLEQALIITGEWLKKKVSVEVEIHTDFDIGLIADSSQQTILQMREQNILSGRAVTNEMKRRSILSSDYDFDADQAELEKEANLISEINEILQPPQDQGTSSQQTPPVAQPGNVA